MDITDLFDAIVQATSSAEDDILESHVAHWIDKRGNLVVTDDLRGSALDNTDLVEPE